MNAAPKWILMWCMAMVCTGFLAHADGKIIFQDDFESGSLKNWDADSNSDDPSRVVITDNPENVHAGKRALEIIAQPGSGKGGKLNKWFMPGYDRVYARFYCKFEDDFDQGNLMHFCHLAANRQDDRWSAFGKAGIRPGGADFFTTSIEPWRDWKRNPAPGAWMMYTYHMDMPADPKMGKYWGQMMTPDNPVLATRGEWICVEMMIQANTPGERDGEQAFWINGDQKARFTGIRWRNDARLLVNDFWLMLYIHENPEINRVWFDDVVIATDYIGTLDADDSSASGGAHP
ncbi:MAG: hypothetical protein GC154_06745 [bacterium]|nr:hypothetical protein [bacterium]